MIFKACLLKALNWMRKIWIFFIKNIIFIAWRTHSLKKIKKSMLVQMRGSILPSYNPCTCDIYIFYHTHYEDKFVVFEKMWNKLEFQRRSMTEKKQRRWASIIRPRTHLGQGLRPLTRPQSKVTSNWDSVARLLPPISFTLCQSHFSSTFRVNHLNSLDEPRCWDREVQPMGGNHDHKNYYPPSLYRIITFI